MLPLAKPTELDDANPGRFTLCSRAARITLRMPRRSQHVRSLDPGTHRSTDSSAHKTPTGRPFDEANVEAAQIRACQNEVLSRTLI